MGPHSRLHAETGESGPLSNGTLEDIVTAVVGTEGDDLIDNGVPQDATAFIEVTDTGSYAPVLTSATVIDGLGGDDQISSAAGLTADSESNIDIPLKYSSTEGTAVSRGISGGEGGDTITSNSLITSVSEAFTTIGEFLLQIDVGVTGWPTNSTAYSMGIDGSDGLDAITNNNAMTVTATSESQVNKGRVDSIDIPADVLGLGDARTAATSTATGISGGDDETPPAGRETITNNGVLTVLASATATTKQFIAELLGAARVDDSTVASALATGVAGSGSDNDIINHGTISVTAVSSATLESTELKLKGLMIKAVMDLFGLDVGKTDTTAAAGAVGIDGGDGNDVITNDQDAGIIDVYGGATADSTTVTVSFSPPTGGGGGSSALLDGGGEAVALAENGEEAAPTAYADADTTALAAATGIAGGEGDDTITNSAQLRSTASSYAGSVGVSADLSFAKENYLPIPGAAVADTSTASIAAAIGIDGGSGNDTIVNAAQLDAISYAEADSVSVAATIKGSLEGFALGATMADSSSSASAATKGVSGGLGDDSITNTGAITALATSQTDSDAVSVTAGGDKIGMAFGVALADATTASSACSYGIDAGDETGGDDASGDTVSNSGTVQAGASSTASSLSVGVAFSAALQGVVGGVSAAKGDTTAEASATGIRTGSAGDTILNQGAGSLGATSVAASTSDVVAVTVSGAWEGAAFGASLADAGTEATATAAGIESGDGGDSITNETTLSANATANVSSDTVSIDVAFSPKGVSAGVALARTETNSEATATGISAGEGDDVVVNRSQVGVDSTATTTTNTISINFAEVGAAIAEASSEAKTLAVGLDGGGGIDSLINAGAVDVTAYSLADDTNAAANFSGYASGSVDSTATAAAIGIQGGIETPGEAAGDTITQDYDGSVSVLSHAKVDASNYVFQGGGAEFAKAGGSSVAEATGIAGSAGADSIVNHGALSATAWAEAYADSFSFQLFGVELGKAGVNAVGTATGIDGGEGSNTITNSSTGVVAAYADVDTSATNVIADLAGAKLVVSGTTAEASSTGILTGAANDTIANGGIIEVTAAVLGEAGAGSIGLLALSLANALAEATITAINAGGGDDVVTNSGAITAGAVKTGDDALVKGNTTAISFDLFSFVLSMLGAKADVTGIAGGGGSDAIVNLGAIVVGDGQHDMVFARSFGFGGQIAGANSAYAGTTAAIAATGIDGGNGDDVIFNAETGSITVDARSHADVDAETYETFGFLVSTADSDADAGASATGILGGAGTDLIDNYGSIDVEAYAYSDAWSSAEMPTGIAAIPKAVSDATAEADAVGVDMGAGANETTNTGSISADATALAKSYAFSDSDFVDTEATVHSDSVAHAAGIAAGNDGNTVTNTSTGTITAAATATASDVYGNFTEARSDESSAAVADVAADATGILLGGGDDTVGNDGTITVSSVADGTVHAYTNSWPYYAQSDATASVESTASGIDAGTGANSVTNAGQVTVSAWSNAHPIADSWSRDSTSTANATANSTAAANGIVADGTVTNAGDGDIDVNARATGYADATSDSEDANATANLSASATGIRTATPSDVLLQGNGAEEPDVDHIVNDGSIAVTAMAGTDENGVPITIAYAYSDIITRDNDAVVVGSSTADVAGIMAGDDGSLLHNAGTIIADGLAHARVRGDAFSRDQSPDANVTSTAAVSAIGIEGGSGDDEIGNTGLIDVNASAVPDAGAWSDSWSDYTYADAFAGATPDAAGISGGSGNDVICNEATGTIDVDSSATLSASASSDENANAFAGTGSGDAIAVTASGMRGGDGNSVLANYGAVAAESTAELSTHASASSTVFTAHATAKTGGSVDAKGMEAGDGNNFVGNYGDLDATATNTSSALANYPTSHLDRGRAIAGGLDTTVSSIATGIWVGDGENEVENCGGLDVTSTANAYAWGYANTSTSTNYGDAFAGSEASASGIAAGNGPNLISNWGDMTVSATAYAFAQGYAEDYGNAYVGNESAPGVIADATGIRVGDGVNEIVNYGTLEVTASADADAFGRAHTTSVDAHGNAVANSFAAAVGIGTGNGGNTVINHGTIDVLAEGSANAWVDVYSTHNDEFRYTYAVTDASSIGIQTGAGDDAIANYGTISAEVIRNGGASVGMGISSGAGNDEVTLAGDSLVSGAIDLGDDDDALIFGGNAKAAGYVTGGLGIDSVIIADTGSFVLSDVTGIEWFKVNEGSLEVEHSYQLVDEGGVVAQINGDGTHGQLVIDGDLGLDGTLEVTRGPWAFVDGTTFDIISADLLNDAFDLEILPLATVLLSFETHQFSDLLQVEALAESFTTVATNPVEMALAEYMDGILPGATGDLSLVLGAFQILDESEFGEAFSSLSPDSYDNSTRTVLENIEGYLGSLRDRMRGLRGGGTAPSAQAGARLQPVLLAYNGPEAGELLNAAPEEARARHGMWAEMFAQRGHGDADAGWTGFDYRTSGLSLGFDYGVTDNVLVGVGAIFTGTDIDHDDDEGKGAIKSKGLSVYGSYFPDPMYVEAGFSYAAQEYDNERRVVVGPIERTAVSDHDGDALSVFAGVGCEREIKKWTVMPFASLEYICLDEDGYEESGADSVNLLVDSRQTQSLVSEVGVSVARVFEVEQGKLIPEVRGAWNYDFGVDDRDITASFEGSPGASFTIEGQEIGEHGLTVGGRVRFLHNGGWGIGLKGDGEFRDDYTAAGVAGEFRFTF